MEYNEIIKLIESATYAVKQFTDNNNTYVSVLSTDSPANIVLEILHCYLDRCNGRFGKISTAQDLCDMLRGAKKDVSGYGHIVYFPRIKWQD